ncbi:hypothetical protein F922_02526 [Acinetobacter baumannii NIPH 201]|nr:hypothetical protein F922_02526 [Acinetobacter baumannii NIPH 201]HDX6152961.1 DUF4113 domain-containing protein [Acinetobacter baumannii]
MCANYEPIRKDRVHLLNLFEPTFDYKEDIYPGYDCPLIFSNNGKIEQLMKTLDNAHTKFGKRKLGISTCYVPGRNWSMSRDKLSKNPFKWDELPLITK